MHRSYDLRALIVQQHGHAVGDVYHQRQPLYVRHKAVGVIAALCADDMAVAFADHAHLGAVDLPCDGEIIRATAHYLARKAVILAQAVGLVAPVFAEVP